MNLIEIIEQGVECSSEWGVYSDGDSSEPFARVGLTSLEGGGVNDGKKLLINGIDLL